MATINTTIWTTLASALSTVLNSDTTTALARAAISNAGTTAAAAAAAVTTAATTATAAAASSAATTTVTFGGALAVVIVMTPWFLVGSVVEVGIALIHCLVICISPPTLLNRNMEMVDSTLEKLDRLGDRMDLSTLSPLIRKLIIAFLDNTNTPLDPTGIASDRVKAVHQAHKKLRRSLGVENAIRIAVAGGSGTGKSSFINAVRGLRAQSRSAAPVGVVETTFKITSYPDKRYPWLEWLDVPGAGTRNCPAEYYFERNGLYMMDCIIVLMGNRFTKSDITILQRALEWKIPALVVRSKSDHGIEDLARTMVKYGQSHGLDDGDDDDDDTDDDGGDDREQIKNLLPAAQEQYIKTVRQNFRQQLSESGLAGHIKEDDCFLVTEEKLRSYMRTWQRVPEAREMERKAASSSSNDDSPAAKQMNWECFRSAVTEFNRKRQTEPGVIDESKLLKRIFTTVGKARYQSAANNRQSQLQRGRGRQI